MKTILLTGGSGFLGSHLFRGLLEQGYEVILLKRSTSNTSRIDDLLNKVTIYDSDKVALETVFKSHTIDAVIHTATVYGRKNEDNSFLLKSNVLFPLQLLDLCVKYNVNSFFNTDTFFNKKELCQYEYLSPYILCKKQLIDWAKYYTNRISFVNMKLEHMYGENDSVTKFIPWVIDKLQKNEELLLTKGIQKRDFIYVKDVVSAYTLLLSKQLTTGFHDFEVGLGKSISIKEMVLKVKNVYESVHGHTFSNLIFGAIPMREGEAKEMKADIRKLTEYGWKPKISAEKGIRNIMNGLKK